MLGNSSIQDKFVLSGAAMLALGGALIGTIIYVSARSYVIDLEGAQLETDGSRAGESLVTRITNFGQDLRAFAGTAPVLGLLRAEAAGGVDPADGSTLEQWLSRLEHNLVQLVDANPDYLRFMLVTSERGGRVLAAAERHGEIVRRLPDDARDQFPLDEYVRASNGLFAGGIHYSNMKLDRLDGLVMEPRTPTVDALTPLVVDGRYYGTLVLTMSFSHYFRSLVDGRNSHVDVMVTNERGEYLHHPDPERAFAFETGVPATLQAEHPAASGFFAPGSREDRLSSLEESVDTPGLLHVSKVRFDDANPNRYYGIALSLPYAIVCRQADALRNLSIIATVIVTLVGGVLFAFVGRRLTEPLRAVTAAAERVSRHDYDVTIARADSREVAALSLAFSTMITRIRQQTAFNKGLAELARITVGETDGAKLASRILAFLAPRVDAQVGAFFMSQEDGTLTLLATYAFSKRKSSKNTYAPGEGLVGQAALERSRIVVDDLDGDYIPISSGLGQQAPRQVAVFPIQHGDETRGVVELATVHSFSDENLEFVAKALDDVGVALSDVASREKLASLLREMSSQTEQLAAQQVELGLKNRKLEQQSEELERTNEELTHQSEKIQQTNDRLVEQETDLLRHQNDLVERNDKLESLAHELETQRDEIDLKNAELEGATAALQERAEQLELASRYKSQFLANMSHELRTPLNSLLVLSKLLADNRRSNLSAEELTWAKTIHAAGLDLLGLINDVLDLAKVEAGKLVMEPAPSALRDVVQHIDDAFRPLAKEKGLDFETEFHEGAPESIVTDARRLEQVLKNLVSNAVKFTHEGSVTLRVVPAGEDPDSTRVAMHVIDTGDGVPSEKCELIFQAFQQADGGTSRKYGGTGLGLSISKHLVELLGGRLTLESTVGVGSTFSVELPVSPSVQHPDDEETTTHLQAPTVDATPICADDSASGTRSERLTLSSSPGSLEEQDRSTVLVIEDDEEEARVLSLLLSESLPALRVTTVSSAREAIAHVAHAQPRCIILDLSLPDTDGFDLLERLSRDHGDALAPVVVNTARDVTEDENARLRLLARSVVVKGPNSPERLLSEIAFSIQPAPAATEAVVPLPSPNADVDLRGRTILLADDDMRSVFAMTVALEERGMNVHVARNGEEALRVVRGNPVELVLMDVMMPRMDGIEAIERMRADPTTRRIPIIALTAKAMKGDSETCLDAGASDYLSKPIEIDALVERIARWIDAEHTEQDVA